MSDEMSFVQGAPRQAPLVAGMRIRTTNNSPMISDDELPYVRILAE